MVESLISRERRPLWAVLSILLVSALGTSLFIAGQTRDRHVDEAVEKAGAIAQSALSPLLRPKDLRASITGQRHVDVSGGIRERITSDGPVQGVTIWSASAHILYAEDEALEGSKDASIRDLLSKAAAGTTQSRVVSDTLQAFTPIRARSGGPVAVAQMDQPYGPVVAGTGSPLGLVLGLSLALLGTLALLVATFRTQGQPDRVVYVPPRPWKKPAIEEPAQVVVTTLAEAPTAAGIPPLPAAPGPASSRRPAAGRPPAAPDAPAAPEPDAASKVPAAVLSSAASDDVSSALEEALRAAEERTLKAEQNYWGLQAQYKQALEEIGVLEARVQVRDQTSSQAEEELRALRDQVRESTERLEGAEVDNKALRERLTLQRTQLDESETQIRGAYQRITHLEAELGELRVEQEELRYRARSTGFEALRQLNEPKAPAAEPVESEEVVVEANERAPRVIIGMPSAAQASPAGPSPTPGETDPQARPGA
jgi:uncharacterized protein (UPF0335 family)